MSVIDFIAVRRRQDNTKSDEASIFAPEKSGKAQTPLTASQFTRHVTQIVEDGMRRSLKRHVASSTRAR